MTNHHKRHCLALIYLFAFSVAKGQITSKLSSTDGTWEDYGPVVSAKTYPEMHGRLVNVNWSDIETSNNNWTWSVFDSDISQHIVDSMPVIVMVYTGPNAPDWIYSTGGVPKVNATDSSGNIVAYSPYYLDANYNTYFKRMITNVCLHIQNYAPSTRNLVIAVQPCFGSTGDPIAYKGTVPTKYQISISQFDSLFKVYSSYYYSQYQGLTPPIRLLSNPNPSSSPETYWLLSNCPGGWIKCGTFAKGTQVNFELDKLSWLYAVLNQPQNGQFVLSRSELTGPQLSAGWWLKDHYKGMFAMMCNSVYWGLDWPNETSAVVSDHNYDSTFAFFNKYAGQKIPGIATNAVCALKDVLDASDSVRFPASTYGTISQTNSNRYINIYNAYSSYGAKLQDVSAAMNTDMGSLNANGVNDVGWHLLPGNYERYLYQINANATSVGYWNIDDADSLVMYGRYGRGFDMNNKKNALYFDVDSSFLRNTPLNGAYPVTIEVTYFDSGYGSWRLMYDAVGNSNKLATKITCTNTHTWIKSQIILTDANFANTAAGNSDFYIQNAGSQNVIFSTVELSRSPQIDAGFMTTGNIKFDTVCINTVLPPALFVLHAASLDGSNVQVGPFRNCTFSTSSTGSFTNSLILSNYGNSINQTIYVQLNTANAANTSGNIPIQGGGLSTTYVSIQSSVVNTSPLLNAAISTVSCYGKKDGSIDLQPTGGTDSATFTYKWTNTTQPLWNATTQDVSALQPNTYNVVVNSDYGCSTSKTFVITQPQVLKDTVTLDSAIVCKGGSTTVTVSATGGTLPYSGTGSFSQPTGYILYTVNDANNCSASKGITVPMGTVTAPAKPAGINGPTSVKNYQTGIAFSVASPNYSYVYTWAVPTDATITSGQGTANVTVTWGITAGSVSVYASNNCGSSPSYSTTKIKVTNSLADSSNVISSAVAGTLSTSASIVLMPNPVKDIAIVKFFTANSETYTMEVSDANGKLLFMRKSIASPGNNIEKLDAASLSAGMYFITLIEQNGERRTIQMVKQ